MSTLRTVQIVVNPLAGNGNGLTLAERLQCGLRGRGHEVRVLAVADLREARARLDREGGDAGCLCCIGGDGTLSRVAPFALHGQIPLVPVPVGFANIFARTFGHRARLSFLLDLLERGTVRWVDVGVAGDDVFLSSQGFGFLEAVKRAVEERDAVPRSGVLRYAACLRAALRTLKGAPLPSVRVEADGDLVVPDAAVAIVANVPTYRGFLALTPQATPFDGLLDVCVVPHMPKPALVSLLLAFLMHLPHRWRKVVYRQGRRVAVTIQGGPEVAITVLPRALPVLVPAAGARC